MNTLEQWIEGWLTCPIRDLNVGYRRKPFPELTYEGMGSGQSASEDLLFQLHQRIKGRRAEYKIWDCVLWNISHPFPDSITNDLIDRNICVVHLAHKSQNEAILKRLVPLVDEALLTYAKVRYYDSNYSAEEFAEIIDQYPTHSWLFDSLAHSTASSPEKREIFLARAREHPNSQRLLETEAGMREAHERRESEKLEKERSLETALNTADEQKIREILEAGDPDLLFCLLKNPNSPDDVLVAISQLRNFGGAHSLRVQAKNILDNRKNSKLKQSKP